MEALHVSMVFQDDWLVNVLLSDGRVYTFLTEMWCEHGSESCWPPVIARAKEEALFLAERNAETWGLDGIPDTEEQFKKGLDFICRHTSDEDFRRHMRR